MFGFQVEYDSDLLYYMGLQGVTRGYRGFQEVTGGCKGFQGVTRGYKGVRRVTSGCKGLQRLTEGYKGSQGVLRG